VPPRTVRERPASRRRRVRPALGEPADWLQGVGERIVKVSRQRGTGAVRSKATGSRTARVPHAAGRAFVPSVWSQPGASRSGHRSRWPNSSRPQVVAGTRARCPRGAGRRCAATTCVDRRGRVSGRRIGRPGQPGPSSRRTSVRFPKTTSPRTTTGRAGPSGPHPEYRGEPRTQRSAWIRVKAPA